MDQETETSSEEVRRRRHSDEEVDPVRSWWSGDLCWTENCVDLMLLDYRITLGF